MPSDSNGLYSLPAGYLATTGLTILASQHNPPLEDIAAGLTARLMRSGVAPMTGPLWMYDGVAGTPGLSFNSAKTTGLFKSTLGMGVSVGGNQVLDFGSSVTFKDGGDIASANALTLGTGNLFNITGTTAVTSIVTKGVGTIVWLRFNGILTFTNDATNLINITGANITTAAGDWCVLEEYGTGTWRMLDYTRVNGNALKTPFAPPASFKNLSIKVASTTTVTVAADFVTTTDGTFYQTTPVSATINLGSNGAVNTLDAGTIAIDTWYAIWVIVKADGTTGALASTSATAPTLPTGYTYKARVGWVQTIHGTATLYGTWQFGRRAQYVTGLAQTAVPPLLVNGSAGALGNNPTLVSQSLTRFVPTTASAVNVIVNNNWTASAVASVLVAPSQSYAGTNNGPQGSGGMPWPIYLNGGVGGQIISAWIILESLAISYASNGAGGAVNVLGWEDNI